MTACLYSLLIVTHWMLQVSEEEVSKLLVTGIEPVNEIDSCFAEFSYMPRSLLDDNTPMVGPRIDTCCTNLQECNGLIVFSAVRPQHVRRHGFHQQIQDRHENSG